MHGGHFTFFGIVRTRLVRKGEDDEKPYTRIEAYYEMILQVCLFYPSLPDIRTLITPEIKFYYEGIRHELKELTKPKS